MGRVTHKSAQTPTNINQYSKLQKTEGGSEGTITLMLEGYRSKRLCFRESCFGTDIAKETVKTENTR